MNIFPASSKQLGMASTSSTTHPMPSSDVKLFEAIREGKLDDARAALRKYLRPLISWTRWVKWLGYISLAFYVAMLISIWDQGSLATFGVHLYSVLTAPALLITLQAAATVGKMDLDKPDTRVSIGNYAAMVVGMAGTFLNWLFMLALIFRLDYEWWVFCPTVTGSTAPVQATLWTATATVFCTGAGYRSMVSCAIFAMLLILGLTLQLIGIVFLLAKLDKAKLADLRVHTRETAQAMKADASVEEIGECMHHFRKLYAGHGLDEQQMIKGDAQYAMQVGADFADEAVAMNDVEARVAADAALVISAEAQPMIGADGGDDEDDDTGEIALDIGNEFPQHGFKKPHHLHKGKAGGK